MTPDLRDTLARKLNEREVEVLNSLGAEWVRPMDIGGRDASDHSRVLNSLVKKGRAEMTTAYGRSGRRYRHRELGTLLDALKLGLQYANLYTAPEDVTDDSADADRETIRRAIKFMDGARYHNHKVSR